MIPLREIAREHGKLQEHLYRQACQALGVPIDEHDRVADAADLTAIEARARDIHGRRVQRPQWSKGPTE